VRAPHLPESQPTCYQAEVLYSGDLPMSHLRHIYVRDAEHADDIAGMCGMLSLPGLTCITQPSVFSA